MTLDRFVEAATDRQAETEHNAESNISEVQTYYLQLLADEIERNDEVYDWFITDGLEQSTIDIGPDAAADLWLRVAELVDLTWDELNTIPVAERGQAWALAASIQSAAAHRQAQIMSGLISQALFDGIENGDDLAADAKGLDKAELQGVHLEIQNQMKTKKAGKKNGDI